MTNSMIDVTIFKTSIVFMVLVVYSKKVSHKKDFPSPYGKNY